MPPGSGNNKTKKKENILHEKSRALFKERMISGCYSPLQYLIGCTIGNDKYVEELHLSDLSDSGFRKRQKWRSDILSVWSVYKENMPPTYFCYVDMRTVVEIAVTGWNNRISAAQPAVLKLRVDSKYF